MVGLREAPVMVAAGAEAPNSGAVGEVVKSGTQRVKRLERPDLAALQQEVEKKNAAVAALKARISEIGKIWPSKTEKFEAIKQEVAAACSQLAKLNNEFRNLVDEKKAVRDELELVTKKREEIRGEGRAMRDKLQFLNQIDEEVKTLEAIMSHTALTPFEETKLKELTKAKEAVNQYNKLLKEIDEDEGFRPAYLEQINKLNGLLNEVKEKQEVQEKVLTEITQQETAQAAEIVSLYEEKNSAYQKIRDLEEEIRVLRRAHRVKEGEYWQREREFKDQQYADRKRDYQKREAERKEREAFRKQKELENFVEPFTDEIILCDQLSACLQFYATPLAGESHSTGAAFQAESSAPEGTVLLSKKRDGDLDGWFAGCGGGKGKGKKPRAPAPLRNKDKERIALSVDVLSSFAKIKLSPPSTIGEVTKSLEDVKVAKDKFLALQVEAREAREKKAQQGDVGLLKARVSDAVNGATVNAFGGSEDGGDAAEGEHGNADNVCIDGAVEEELGILEVPEGNEISSNLLQFPPLRPEKVGNGKGPAKDGSGLEVPQETADTSTHELHTRDVEKQKHGMQETAAVNLDNSKLGAVEAGEATPPPVAAVFFPAELFPEVAAALLALQVEAREPREIKEHQEDAGVLKTRVSDAVNGTAVNAFGGSEDGGDAAEGKHSNGHNVSIDGVVQEELGILEVPDADETSSNLLEFPPLRPEKVGNGKGPAKDGSGLEVPQETADTTTHELQTRDVEKQKDGIIEPVESSQGNVKLAEPELGTVEVTDLGLTISELELSFTEPELGIVEVAEDDLGILEVGSVLKQETTAAKLDHSKLDAVECVPEVAATDAA